MLKIEDKVAEVYGQYVPKDTTAASFLAAKDGNVLFRKAFGFADIENGIPAKSEDNFIIASNTKQFACLAILMLRDRGLLALDETIDRFFPDFPDYTKKITVRMLMCHISGIPEYFNNDNGFPVDFAEADTKRVLEIIKDLGDETLFEPGTQFEYSNSAFVMLGDIVRQLSGKMFGKFVETEIFAPLGMDRSFAPDYMDQKDPWQVEGYAIDPETGILTKVPYDMLEVGYADGNISSNVDDLLKWHAFLYGDDPAYGADIIDKSHLKELYTRQKFSDGTPTPYCLGIMDGNLDEEHQVVFPDRRELWHTGGTTGFISRVSYFPEEKVSLMMLTNWLDVPRDDLFREFAKIVFSEIDGE